ncbi:MAG: TonB-dependent receptor [Prevotellaceae bacterium]|nr:TonB-dependent receptor [Prevotellaceae bacterium]
MYNYNSNKKQGVFKFKRFGRKGYSLFAVLGRVVVVGVLSVATLSKSHAEGVGVKPVIDNDTTDKTDRELTLDEVSVTGSRAPLTRAQAARMVTVLERADIQAAPVQSVNDLLKYVASVDVRQRGPIGAQTDISIRGGNYEQITILLNGINICDPQTGHNAFDFPVDISEIERIEVLEGPAGRVYGTSSLLGAINIVTRPRPTSSVSAHIEGGSYGYLSAGARANVASGKWNNQLSGSYSRSDGYQRNSAGGLNSDYSGGKAFYQGTYDDDIVSVSWHAGLSTKDFGSNTFYGAKWDDQFEHTLKTYTALQAETKKGSFHLKPSIYWNHSYDRFELFRDAAEKYPFNYHRTDIFGVNLNGYFDWILGRTAVGAELRNEDLLSGNLGEPLDNPHHISGTDRYYDHGINRTNISFVVEHNILLRRFTLSAGLVAVKNSWNGMNMKVYPGIDASYRIGDSFKIFANYNTSLRMPSVTELYYSVGGHVADKNLKPEEISSVEAGVKYADHGITTQASVYHNNWKNMIDWIRYTADGPDAPWQSVNFTEVKATGFQAQLTLNFRQIVPTQRILKSFNASYNYLFQDKDIDSSVESKYSLEYLRHKLVANLQLNIVSRLDLGINFRWQDRRGIYTDFDGTVKEYSPYSVVDARLSWTAPKYKLYLEANNIFDKTYIDYGYVPQPGTWLIAGLSVEL